MTRLGRDATCEPADDWQREVEQLDGAPAPGRYSRRPYYLRVTKNGDAGLGHDVQIGDGGPLIDQRHVVDPSFLDLVRLGRQAGRRPGHRSTRCPWWTASSA